MSSPSVSASIDTTLGPPQRSSSILYSSLTNREGNIVIGRMLEHVLRLASANAAQSRSSRGAAIRLVLHGEPTGGYPLDSSYTPLRIGE
jgi:hypothetical protein